MKITPQTSQKVVWQKFENQKSDIYKIFIFSRWSSWNVTFFLETLYKGSKSSSKMDEIEKNEKSIKMFCKNLDIKMIFKNFCPSFSPCHFAPFSFDQGQLESGLLVWSLIDLKIILRGKVWHKALLRFSNKSCLIPNNDYFLYNISCLQVRKLWPEI